MKSLALILFFVFSSNFLFSQLPKGFSLEEKSNETFSILRKKKSIGLYNQNTNKFEVGPFNGNLVYLKKSQLLIKVEGQHITVLHLFDHQVEEIASGTDKLKLYNSCILDWNSSVKGELNTDIEKVPRVRDKPKIEFYLYDNYLICEFEYQSDYLCEPDPIMSIENPGEDSVVTINGYAQVVYYKFDPTLYLSGVYNLETHNWALAPKYNFVRQINKLIVGITFTDDDLFAAYDYYQITKKGIQPSRYQNHVSSYMPLDLLPDDKEYWYGRDSSFVFFKDKKGTGLVRIQQGSIWVEYDENGIPEYTRTWQHWNIQVDTLFNNEYEFIALNGFRWPNTSIIEGFHYALAYKDGEWDLAVEQKVTENTYEVAKNIDFNKSLEIVGTEPYYSEDKPYQIEFIGRFDDKEYKKIGFSKGVSFPAMEYKLIEFNKNGYHTFYRGESSLTNKIELNGDSLINFTSFFNEKLEDYVAFTDSEGNDSINAKGEVVYVPPNPGSYSSGVYDIENRKWIISPENIKATRIHNGFLIEKPLIKYNGNIYDYLYDVRLDDGSFAFQNIKEENFIHEQKYRKYTLPKYNVNSMYSFNPGWDYYSYFETNEGTGIASYHGNFSKLISPPHPLVKYNIPCNTYFWYDHKKLHIYSGGNNSSFDKNPFNVSLDLVEGTKFSVFGRPYAESEKYIQKQSVYYVILNQNDSISKYETSSRVYGDKGHRESYFKRVDRSDENYSKIKEQEYPQWGFSFEILKNSKLYVEDFQKEIFYTYTLTNDYGEDSVKVMADGMIELVYPEPIPGLYRSGVYDLEKEEWFLKPIYKTIIYGSEKYYITETPVLNEKGVYLTSNFQFFKDGSSIKLGDFPKLNVFDNSFVGNKYLCMNNGRRDYKDVPVIDENGYEMYGIDDNGRDVIVYEEAVKGINKSGVFNVETGQWYIPMEYYQIIPVEEDELFIAVYSVLDENGFSKKYQFSIFDFDGKERLSKVSIEKLDQNHQVIIDEIVR